MAANGYVTQNCTPVMESIPGDTTENEHKQAVQGMLVKHNGAAVQKISHRFGFPLNLAGQVGELDFLAKTQFINLGDPFVHRDIIENTTRFEVGVLDWFASLWGIKKSLYWGYITGGGSESTMYSLYTAREKHPDGILYTSEDTHYSIFKAAHMLKIPLKLVSSLDNGEIDYSELKIRLIENWGRPAIIGINFGTTMKGATDNIEQIADILKAAGYPREKFYIHCDAALFGLMLPFAQKPCQLSFRNPIDSVSVSGHKFLGCPQPCSILIIRKSHRKVIGEAEIIAAPDTTVSGSRNGQAALHMWYLLSMKGKLGIEQDVKNCLENAEWLQQFLTNNGVGAYRNPYSNIVFFDKPNDKNIVDRWHLACQGSLSHVVVMQHMSKHNIKKFASELSDYHNYQI